jgi:hypothetical protein
MREGTRASRRIRNEVAARKDAEKDTDEKERERAKVEAAVRNESESYESEVW